MKNKAAKPAGTAPSGDSQHLRQEKKRMPKGAGGRGRQGPK